MPSFRDIKGRPIEEALTSRDDVRLDDEDGGVSGVVGKAIVVSENPHRDEIAAAREKALKERGPKPPRANPPLPAPLPSFASELDPPRAALPLPDDIEAALAAIETTATELHIAVTDGVRILFDQIAALRARAQMDHEKLAKVDSIIAALKQS